MLYEYRTVGLRPSLGSNFAGKTHETSPTKPLVCWIVVILFPDNTYIVGGGLVRANLRDEM